MGIKKTTVAAAVSATSSKVSPKAKEAPTQPTDWDSMLINNSSEDTTTDAKGNKTYVNYMGKDRLLREAPGWGDAKGQIVQFVIYGSDENGTPLPDLPKTRFGSLADVEYCEKKYPMSRGFYVNDQVCRNGRHKIDIYKIHICGVRKVVEEVE